MAKIRIAQLQTRVVPGQEENLAALPAQMEAVCQAGTDLVCLPEMFCCPYGTENFPRYAQEEGGPVYQALSGLAKSFGVYLSAGSVPERGEGGRLYNTAYMFDRQGRQIGKHRKIHLFDVDMRGKIRFLESRTLSPGDQITVFETEFCKMGLCICYDIRFPELSRAMTDRGAQVILVPAAFNRTTGPLHWELLFRSRAADNQVFTVGTSPALDMAADYHAWGHSLAVDPWGKVLGQLSDETGVLYTQLDLEQISQVRQQLPLLRQRRKDVYGQWDGQ